MKNLSVARAVVAASILATAFAAALVFSPSGAATRALVGTNIVVNSTSDAASNDGLCTLREAITSANNNTASGIAANECAAGTGNDTITFSVTGTISLTSALPGITSDMTISGPGAKLLTVARSSTAATDFHVFTIYPGEVVSISGLTITGGKDNLSAGGVQNLGTTLIDRCAISGNTGHAGGGISNEFSGNLTVYNSTISGNSSPDAGGGINNIAAVTVINSTISGNRTNLSGGGINTGNSGSTLTVVNSTITDNHADVNDDLLGGGGGIGISETVTTLRNTIVAGNSRRQASPTRDDVDGNLQAASSFNLIGDGTGMTGISAGTGGNRVGTNVAPIDPLLAPLADNGGQTQTHALLAGSPAIDSGDNSLALDASNNALTTDQRGTGFPRIADSADADATQTVDIGAFEAYPSVEDITDKTTNEDSTLSFNFNVGDAALSPASVAAASSNTTLVPNDSAHISVTGTGSQRTLNITPASDANGTATITVTATAGNGQTATDTFLLTVNAANDPPTGIGLSNNVVADNSPANTTVGTFSTTDADASDTFTYALVGGAGGLDNNFFAVSGSTLKTAAVIDYETKRTYSVRVRTTDSGGLSFEQVLLINVSDGPDTTGALSFSAAAFSANEADGVANITLKRTGGADNKAVARIGLADVTTSPADYVYAPGSLDTTFNHGTGADDHVRGVAIQPDGKVIVVGDFTTYDGTPRVGVARVNADGSLDTSFDVGSGTTSTFRSALAVALQPDGKIIVGGTFTAYNGVTRNGIARVNADGSLDTSFDVGSGVNDRVQVIVLQPDGKVIIGGRFNVYNGVMRPNIARLNVDGSLDTTFNVGAGTDGGGGFGVQAIALQPDGKVLVGGSFESYNGTPRNNIARLNSNGSLDTSFNPGAGAVISANKSRGVMALALQPDGKMLVGGGFVSYDGAAVNGLVRVNPDGSRDASFNPGFVKTVDVDAIALQPDGKVIAGMFTSTGPQPTSLARLNASGSLDTSFNVGSGPFFGVFAAALQPDGKVVIGGSFDTYNDTPRMRIARVNGDLFVTWEAGDSSNKTLSLPLVNDSLVEANETLSLSLNAFGAGAGAPSNATLTINDDDTAVSSVSGSGVYGGTATLTATLTLAGSPLSGKTITFFFGSVPVGTATTDASGVATLTGVSLSIFNAGTYTSVLGATFASEPGLSGSGAIGTLNISKASQTINFGALADKTFGDGIFQLSATASSGLSVSYSSSGNCVVADSTFVHINGAGSCTITASQAGDVNYTAAADVARTFQIAKAATTTTVTTSANPSAIGQDVTFTIKVTSAAGTPSGSVRIEVEGGGSGVLHLDGVNPVVFGVGGLAAGTHTVNVSFDGNDNFAPSNTSLAGGQVVGSLFEFGQSTYNVAEGASLTVTVKRLGDTSQAASVDYATDDGSTPSVVVQCSSVTGIALDRCDFTKTLGTLQFAAGEAEKTFVVFITDDSYVEGPETAHLKLSNPSSNGVLGAGSVAAFTINDDSPESTGNPSDDDEKFVIQHYRDFLNRDPDASGLAFWKSQIASCGQDTQCREVRRVNVSAAFFLSIEFQQTGNLVNKMYKAGFGNLAGKPVAVQRASFIADTQQIQSRPAQVIVGQGNWQAQLETNKTAFAQEFVQRPAFLSAHGSQTVTEYVDSLFANAGVTPTAAERNSAIGAFGGGGVVGHAAALRSVADSASVTTKTINESFVLMQYFGYLQRDPDAAPDTNFDGYNFWLGKLNQFGGDFIKAEMVKAFLASDEYRHRFGQ